MDKSLLELLERVMREKPPCDNCLQAVQDDCANTRYECPAFISYSNKGVTSKIPKPRLESFEKVFKKEK